ncbi:exosporium protein CsxA [Clostridium sp. CTA-19]
MSINLSKFSPRPGLVNKQGCLPDPSELVCIEVPKIFDQCLIKRCLVYCAGSDTNTTDCELRSNPLINPKIYVNSRDFNLTLISVEKIPLIGKPGFKKLVISYKISFYSDYIDANGMNQSELFEINRTDVIGKFYCPDSVAQISASFIPVHNAEDLDSNIIKLEMVANALDGRLLKDENCNDVLDITLGYYIVVKCELIVQLLIPTYGYCPVPKEPCEKEPEENPCERFEKAPIPKFYPDQNLEPLFPDCDCDCDHDCHCDCDDR